MKAIIDRFEEDYAVLLVGDEEIKVDLPKSLLPKGAREGSWLTLALELDLELTRKREENISSLLEKLKRKNDK